VKGVPGRATSLVSVGLLLGLSVLVAALGATPGVSQGGGRAGTALAAQAQAHDRPGAQSHPATGPSHPDPATGSPTTGSPTTGNPTTGNPTTGNPTTGNMVAQSFRCLYPEGAKGQAPVGIPELTSSGSGTPPVTATTFCRDSSWYVAERIGERASRPFQVPVDPPIPPSVTVQGFVPVLAGSIPAILVQRDNFGSAQLYELFTSSGARVDPVHLVPGRSPVLLLKASSQTQGAGFTCTSTPSGEVIRQYEWYIINTTTLRTTAQGSILGDPEVYLETTVYTAASASTFTSSTDAIVPVGYTTVVNVSSESC